MFFSWILFGTNIQISQCVSPWLGLSHSSDEDGSSDGEKRRHDDDDDDEEEDIDGVALEEPLPKKQKITMGFNKTFGSIKSAAVNEKKNIAPITIKLGPQVNNFISFQTTSIKYALYFSSQNFMIN